MNHFVPVRPTFTLRGDSEVNAVMAGHSKQRQGDGSGEGEFRHMFPFPFCGWETEAGRDQVTFLRPKAM